MDLGPGKLTITPESGEEPVVVPIKSFKMETPSRKFPNLSEPNHLEIEFKEFHDRFNEAATEFGRSMQRAKEILANFILATSLSRIAVILATGGILFTDVRGNVQVILGPDREAMRLHGKRLRNFRRRVRRERQLREAIGVCNYSRADELTRNLYGTGFANYHFAGQPAEIITTDDCRDAVTRARASLVDSPNPE